MEKWRGRIALVTGASSGIGKRMVQELLKHDMKVIGCARRKDMIRSEDESKSSNFFAYSCDFKDPANIEDLFSKIKVHPDLGRVDLCVCNAGTTSSHGLLDASVGEWTAMVNVNIVAVSLCVQLSVKIMLEQNITDGHIVFINSMSGHAVHPHPRTRFYSATKYAVTALVEGWRQEIADLGSTNIRVSSISPRLVETEFAFLLYPGEPEEAQKIYDSVPCLQDEDIAASLIYVMSAPEHVQVQDVQIAPTKKKY